MVKPTMWKCDNCKAEYRKEEDFVPLEKVPALASRLEPGSTVPAGECRGCGALVYGWGVVPV